MYVTLKACADKAGINISSARFYKDKFLQYFATSGEGRNTKYDEESTVEILALISKLYKQNMDEAQIIEELENRYGIPTVGHLVQQEKDNNSETTQQELINAVTEVFRGEISRLEDKIDELAQGSKSRDELLMETLVAIRERDRKKSWKWWK